MAVDNRSKPSGVRARPQLIFQGEKHTAFRALARQRELRQCTTLKPSSSVYRRIRFSMPRLAIKRVEINRVQRASVLMRMEGMPQLIRDFDAFFRVLDVIADHFRLGTPRSSVGGNADHNRCHARRRGA